MQHRSLTLLALLASVGIASSAFAQPQNRDRQRDAERVEQPDVLKGPEVQRQTPPGVRGSFGGEEMQPGRRVPNQQFAMIQFWDAIMSLDAPDVPDALALTDAQHEQFKAITAEHREKVGLALGREGGPDAGPNARPNARPQGRPEGRPAGRPEGRPAGRPEGRPEGRPAPAQDGEARPERPARQNADRPQVNRDEAERVPQERRERRNAGSPERAGEQGVDGQAPASAPAGRPRPAPGAGQGQMTPEQRQEFQQKQAAMSAELQTRIWAVLTPPQKAYAEAELSRIKAEFEAMTEEERVKAYMERRRNGAAQFGPGAGPGAGPEGRPQGRPGLGREGAPGAGLSPERREAMRQRFEAMSPEERAEALRLLREDRQRRQAPAREGEARDESTKGPE